MAPLNKCVVRQSTVQLVCGKAFHKSQLALKEQGKAVAGAIHTLISPSEPAKKKRIGFVQD